MNNPPAFPIVYQPALRTNDGMTLRDYAAISVLQSISRIPREHETILEDVELAFQYADAVLKVREK